MKLFPKLQKLIDNGYADKLNDYPEYRNFERIQIGEFLIFIYHPSKDEYVARLIQGNDILDSESYQSHYPAFNKCLEYMKNALDASGYTDVQDWIDHPNSMVNAINKNIYLDSIAPLTYIKWLDTDNYVLAVLFKEMNWIEYWDTSKISKELNLDIRSMEYIRVVPEHLKDFTHLCGIPEEGNGYKLLGQGSIDTDKLVNQIANLSVPYATGEYLRSILDIMNLAHQEYENIIQGWKQTSKFDKIKSEITKIESYGKFEP